MERNRSPAVKSLDRGLDILEYVAAAARPPAFSRFLADLGIPRSSLAHLLNNLQARGYLAREDAGDGYRLGPRLGALAAAGPRPSLAVRVGPILRELSRELNETCGFYVRVDDEVEVIASAISTQALSFTMKVGARAPLYAVSAGKIALAELDAAALKRYLAGVALIAATAKTIRSKTRLRDEVRRVAAAGFAFSHEEFTPGISAVAIAVRQDGRFVGALNVAVPTVRFTTDRVAVFQNALRIAAQAVAGSPG